MTDHIPRTARRSVYATLHDRPNVPFPLATHLWRSLSKRQASEHAGWLRGSREAISKAHTHTLGSVRPLLVHAFQIGPLGRQSSSLRTRSRRTPRISMSPLQRTKAARLKRTQAIMRYRCRRSNRYSRSGRRQEERTHKRASGRG